MVMVITILIAVATIVVFVNGIAIGSLNRIRPDQPWNKHNSVDGLMNLIIWTAEGYGEHDTKQIEF